MSYHRQSGQLDVGQYLESNHAERNSYHTLGSEKVDCERLMAHGPSSSSPAEDPKELRILSFSSLNNKRIPDQWRSRNYGFLYG
jgi:hypothetical protein